MIVSNDKRSRQYRMAKRVATAITDAMLGRVSFLQRLGTDVRWEPNTNAVVFTEYKEIMDPLKGRRYRKQVWRVQMLAETVGGLEQGYVARPK